MRTKKNRGQAVVELALTLPVALMLISGAIDISRYFFYREALTEVARDTSRRGCLRGVHEADLTTYGNQRFAAFGLRRETPHFASVTVTARDASTNGSIDYDTAQSGDTVQVQAQCTFDTAFGMLTSILGSDRTIRARSMCVME